MMDSRWKRVGAIVGVVGLLALSACEASVDTPEGDAEIENPAGEGEGGEGGGD